MGTKNYGLPTSLIGHLRLRFAVVKGFKIIDEQLKRVSDAASGEPAAVTAESITDATATGKSLIKAASEAAARAAIGAGTSDFSGSYDDLTELPTIPPAAAEGSAALILAGTDKVQRLWTAEDLAAEIDRRIAAAAI